MKHFASPEFWACYRSLPAEVQRLADKNFELLKENPRHSSLRLKKVGQFWSARVGKGHRAIAAVSPTGLVWFWIGNHAEYDRLIE